MVISLSSSAHPSQPHRSFTVRLLQDHGRRHRADCREPAQAALARRLMVPESDGRSPRVHCMRPQQPGTTHARQVLQYFDFGLFRAGITGLKFQVQFFYRADCYRGVHRQ
jgi:hypothetical protein